MKNAFYCILKALFVLRIFKFLSWLFAHAEKQLDDKLNFKVYDVTDWSKKSKLSILLGQYSKVLYSLFLMCVHVEDYRNM